MAKCTGCRKGNTCYKRVKEGISKVFTCYGEIVGRHPVYFIVGPILIFGAMGIGLLVQETESGLEEVYFPKHSRASKNRQEVSKAFLYVNDHSYNGFSQSHDDFAVNLIFKTKSGQSIFDPTVTAELNDIVKGVEGLTSKSGTIYREFCARVMDKCAVIGKMALDSSFQSRVAGNAVTYPIYNNVYLADFISRTTATVKGGKLIDATVIKISFKLSFGGRDWEETFGEYAANLNPTTVDRVYELPNSLSSELDKNTKGDIVFFVLTIIICCIYASVVSTGGNPVSTRGMLACAGILAAGLGILGSLGLLSACGVKYVNIVGVIPFLIVGIGVDDMFLMMTSWSESLPSDEAEQTVQNVPKILGKTLARAGIGITITSVTDFLAFALGTTTVFMVVTNFSIYAGVAVLFCYLANVTLFAGCLAIHGRRVYSWRHFCTCMVTKSRADLQAEGRSKCFALVCGGNPPRKDRDDSSLCEMIPARFLPRLFKKRGVSVVILVCFLLYLATSIYGLLNLKQGLLLQDLVRDNSYYHKYLRYSDKYFPVQFPVGFIAITPIDFSGNDGTKYLDLLVQARKDAGIDSQYERCWLTSYKSSSYYNAADFIDGLQSFLKEIPDFLGDVVINISTKEIQASRCFVYSAPNTDQFSNAKLMLRMRELADDNPLPVFAYHASFVSYEQFLAVLPATVQTVVAAVCVMALVTFVFLPHFLMVLLVVITIIMILVGIFGFLYYWNLTLSSITMVHLVMSVGFSVDFSAHVCTAYLLSHAVTRQERAVDAIHHAAAPILNGAMSTFLGVILLLGSSSFIFQSFFKVMCLVILFGMLHAVFFLPAILSLVGPENRNPVNNDVNGGESMTAIGVDSMTSISAQSKTSISAQSKTDISGESTSYGPETIK